MSKKFKVWLDSGANIHSRREAVVTLDQIGISESEWEIMTDDEREDVMRDIAFDHSDWGFVEVDDVP
jgi:hypothetical protein